MRGGRSVSGGAFDGDKKKGKKNKNTAYQAANVQPVATATQPTPTVQAPLPPPISLYNYAKLVNAPAPAGASPFTGLPISHPIINKVCKTPQMTLHLNDVVVS